MEEVLQISSWQKVSELGSGAFGVVSLWKNAEDEFIAIKQCKCLMPGSLTAKQKERWKQEVKNMKLIQHPNIVSFKEIPPELEKGLLKHNPTKLPLLSMEYCQKGNLRHLLLKPSNTCGLEEYVIRYILSDISSGLQYLHNLNITHRDLKPENIVLQHCSQRKDNTVYKIIDLGYAKELNDSTVSFVGTLNYLAPEIFETIKYDSSVDYWSLGIMTFELICGMLPFLPQLSPPERFVFMKKKGKNDIQIYRNSSGQIAYSSELPKGILTTSCFKGYIEEWLRHVLQFDPIARVKNFPNGAKVFTFLQQILKKTIIKVFTLYRFEFYSYEIDDNTLVGTLKDWISRDIKIERNDLILLFKDEFFASNDQLVSSVLSPDDYVFAINRDCLIHYPLNYDFPKLIREVMSSALNFNHNHIWQLYGQAVYYITIERITANLFRCGLQYYIGYLKQSAEHLRKRYIFISKKLGNLLVRVDCCTTIRKNNISDNNICDKDYMECLMSSRILLDRLEENLQYFREFKTKIDKTFNRLTVLITLWPRIVVLVNNYNLIEQYNKVISALDKSNRGKNPALLKTEITDVVSQSIRLKDSLFNQDQTFIAYIRGIVNVEKHIASISLWVEEYDKSIRKLTEAYMKNEILYWNIRMKLIDKHKKLEKSLQENNPRDCISSLLQGYLKLTSESILDKVTTSVEATQL